SPAPILDRQAVASRYSLRLGRPARRIRVCSLNRRAHRSWRPLYNNDIRTLGIACPRDALMKTRRRNRRAEIDAEIRAFVLGFETRSRAARRTCAVFASIFATDHKVMKNNDLAGWGGRIRTSEWRNQNPLPSHWAPPHRRLSERRGRKRCRGSRSTPAACERRGREAIEAVSANIGV